MLRRVSPTFSTLTTLTACSEASASNMGSTSRCIYWSILLRQNNDKLLKADIFRDRKKLHHNQEQMLPIWSLHTTHISKPLQNRTRGNIFYAHILLWWIGSSTGETNTGERGKGGRVHFVALALLSTISSGWFCLLLSREQFDLGEGAGGGCDLCHRHAGGGREDQGCMKKPFWDQDKTVNF